ncbi:MAG: hypothetical protein JW751_10350 [Polyangiaceae bacterium]|nr:hypothetical protein [Polyangiaceae bacterium]
MLRVLHDLERYAVSASDGDVGNVADFYFDDERWAIRYLVVETGHLFAGRPVLISPISFRQVDWSTRHFHLALTQKNVRESPSVDVDKPVSRQHEQHYAAFYGYPNYWGNSGLWGTGAYPALLAAERRGEVFPESAAEAGDGHLRSAREVRGYTLQGSDDVIGHLDGFIVDDETWQVRYMVIATNGTWFGKKVLIAPQWATRVSWTTRAVYVNIPRQAVKSCPEWDPNAAINREYETRLYDYYGRPVQWANAEPSLEATPPLARTLHG